VKFSTGMIFIQCVFIGFLGWKIHSLTEQQQGKFLQLEQQYTALNDDYQQVLSKLNEGTASEENYLQLIAGLNQQLLAFQTNHLELNRRVELPQGEVIPREKVKPINELHRSNNDPLLAFARQIKAGGNPERDAREQFANEEVDENWAYEHEDNIRSLVAADEEQRFNIQELNCKSTACEMKVLAESYNATSLGVQFSKLLGEQRWQNKQASILFSSEVKDGVMNIFINRY